MLDDDFTMTRRWIPAATWTLIALNVIMFAITEVSGGSTDPDTLLRFGANFSPLTRQGEWWRLFTSMFLHAGIAHIGLNCISLYNLGPFVERYFGRLNFLIIYFISGFTGSLASTILHTYALSVGASGAIFGVAGSMVYAGLADRNLRAGGLLGSLLPILAINLAYGFTAANIDNYAHLGGLAGGFLFGFIVSIGKSDL